MFDLTSIKAFPLNDPLFEEYNLRIDVARLDLIDSIISGNKWFKLKYNLLEAQTQQHDTLLTFGGAFSNHIYATAKAGQLYGFKTIGVIRGEPTYPLNSTLSLAVSCGMHLYYLDRSSYRKKATVEITEVLESKFGRFYSIPEGGSNLLGVKGCSEIVPLFPGYNYYCTCVGTGATLAGLVASLSNRQKSIGFSVLKGGDFLYDDVDSLLKEYFQTNVISWREKYSIQADYHFGGYAKNSPSLQNFIDYILLRHKIPLEYVYTAKMFFGVYDLVRKNFFMPNSKILLLHTGGLRA